MDPSQSVRDFFMQLAKEIKRDPKSFEPFIKKLEDEWFDTVSALKLATPAKLTELGIPARLQIEIQNRLGGAEEQKAAPVPQQAFVSPPVQPAPVPEPFTEPKMEHVKTKPKAQSEWELMLMIMRDEIPVPSDHQKGVNILKTVISNLIEYPGEKKYRTIRLSNEAIAKTIGRSKAAISFLQKVRAFFLTKERRREQTETKPKNIVGV